METPTRKSRSGYNPKFLEFFERFASIGADPRLFPKKCRTCGHQYRSFPDYIHYTESVGQGLADFSDAMDFFGIMQYRNCKCGSTLALVFTREIYHSLDKLWEMLGAESRETGIPFPVVVSEFREQCNRYILEHDAVQRVQSNS